MACINLPFQALGVFIGALLGRRSDGILKDGDQSDHQDRDEQQVLGGGLTFLAAQSFQHIKQHFLFIQLSAYSLL